MTGRPKYALLRDGTRWEWASATRLQTTECGDLQLTPLPAGAAGADVDIRGPWQSEASGIAVAENGLIYISNTAANEVLCLDPLCGTRTRIGGLGFSQPRGLLISHDRLYVADSGNARVQVFDTKTFGLLEVWQGSFGNPAGLATDLAGRIYVLDVGTHTVVRLSASGVTDDAYSDAIATGGLSAPAFLAIDRNDVLYVSDAVANRVVRFADSGQALGPLEGLDAAMPGAIATAGSLLYVADTAIGALRAYDLDASIDLGVLPGFRGPVSALAIDCANELLIKTDLDLNTVRLHANLGCAGSGRLVGGPLDAGINQTWERVVVTGMQPADTRVQLEVYVAATMNKPPAENEWVAAPTLDTLVPPPPHDGSKSAASARFLWLRVTLGSDDKRASPILSQVQATTVARSYIEHLPAVYARKDQENDFLRRWLALFRSELGDVETLLDDIARRFDPATAPADHLRWLAEWVGFEPPGREAPSWSLPWVRELILRAHDIYTRRGTNAGLREAIALRTGLRPQIIEAYRDRRIWQLGFSSRLGFDTALAPARADGAIVPDPVSAIVVGDFVVNQSGPQEADDFGAPLFADEAHLFRVMLPAASNLADEQRARLKAVVDAEKPAHTDYHLCLIGSRMRVGFQARIGIDAIVAGPREPFALNVSRLGLDTFVSDSYKDASARVGYRSSIGQTLRVG